MKSRLKGLLACSLAFSMAAYAGQTTGPAPEPGAVRFVPADEVEWQALNPARGDASPLAGTLWGDRNAEVPTGFLARFRDGFSSPPHIHNATYRAVVIAGSIHNDDPNAVPHWMPPGSFWTQPRGEVHITAAQGDRNIALVEIDRGPYLVMPPSEAFDSGERPVNLDRSNLFWVPLAEPAMVGQGVDVAYLWGALEPGVSRGVFIRLPVGFEGVLHSKSDEFHGVVIEGLLHHAARPADELAPGSYFGAVAPAEHALRNAGAQAVVLYLRTNDELAIELADP